LALSTIFPWLGITGTNGKTTTTALCAAIFQKAGLNAPSCGNIGYAACELPLKLTNTIGLLQRLVVIRSSLVGIYRRKSASGQLLPPITSVVIKPWKIIIRLKPLCCKEAIAKSSTVMILSASNRC